MENKRKDFVLLGRKAIIDYGHFKVQAEYFANNTFHWKTTFPTGQLREDDEKLSYKKLSDEQHFLSWIEKDGLTVSQVINTKEKTVSSFTSYPDEKSERGNRAGTALEGKIEFMD